MSAAAGLGRDVVVLACAVSAGIHGALAPAHFAEGDGAGGGFVAASVLLAVLAVALVRMPSSPLPLAGAALVLAGLIASYALAATTGMPVLHPHAEPVDGLGLATKAIEAVGLLAATLQLKGTTHERHPGTAPDPTRADRTRRPLQRSRRAGRVERA